MLTNATGLAIIKHFEGWSAAPYLCPAGIPTIGYGSLHDGAGQRVTMSSNVITLDVGELLLRRHLARTERQVAALLNRSSPLLNRSRGPLNASRVQVTANEFSALVSFAYNVGTGALRRSTLLRKLKAGDRAGAAAEFPKWRRGGGRILPGLVRRRAAEQSLFLAVALTSDMALAA